MRHCRAKERYSGSICLQANLRADIDEWLNVGDSAIANPKGEFIPGPLREQEGILYAEIDPVQMQAAKWTSMWLGITRPDVFQLTVGTCVHPMITSQGVGPPSNVQSREVTQDNPPLAIPER